MCGIAGIMSLGERPVREEEVRAMCDSMIHRGPNDAGYFVDPGIALGMRRLSIIDLATGRQPIHNEDGSVWVVFNGEIYNFRSLRPMLERQGHQFYTDTDTEVIVHLYEAYGDSCVDHLRGMFAFALWDARAKRLLVARDRLGVKPLYFGEVQGRLVFASELKAILEIEDVARDLNWSSVSHLFASMCTPSRESIVRGIHKLEPGHVLTATAGQGVRVQRYWDVEFRPDTTKDEAYFVERLRELLDESVRMRLVSDVPLGAFLSGGIDSSAVVASMARAGGRVKTFSIGFDEPEFNELEYARKVAERYGTEHHECILQPDVLGIIEDFAWFLDEPFGDSSAIPTYMVSRLAASAVTVVLSGDGGDELFAGYDRYRVEQRERKYDRIPSPARKLLGSVGTALRDGAKGKNFLRHISLQGHERYIDANVLFRKPEEARLFQPGALREIQAHDPGDHRLRLLSGQSGHWLSALQYLDIKHYLPNDILTKVDRMSMANSLEAREPLLDHKLVEFAATVPPGFKLRGETTKYIFKKAMDGILPNEILYRPKRGFAIPLAKWFRGELDGFARDLLLSKRSRERGILNPLYIDHVLRLNSRGRDMDLQIWTMMAFELWCRRFMDSSARGGSLRETAAQFAGIR